MPDAPFCSHLDALVPAPLTASVGRTLQVSTVFTYKIMFRAVVASFLLAQAVIWAGEIRAVGIKEWLKDGMGKPYAKYFSLLSPTHRLRLIVLWALFFAVTILIIVFV